MTASVRARRRRGDITAKRVALTMDRYFGLGIQYRPTNELHMEFFGNKLE